MKKLILAMLVVLLATQVCHSEKVKVGKRTVTVQKCMSVITVTNKVKEQPEQLQYGCFETTIGGWTGIVCYEPPIGWR